MTSRRRFLLAAGGAGLAATVGCSGPSRTYTVRPPTGALAANLNANYQGGSFAGLESVSASWVRGIQMTFRADQEEFPADTTVGYLLEAANRGYGTVLCLCYLYRDQPLPRPGTEEFQREIKRTDKILDACLGKVDVLVIGNEPFVDTGRQDGGEAVNAFYQAMAKHVIAYRKAKCGDRCRTQLYMGALTFITTPASQTPAVEEWMRFTRETPQIQGTDIHPHEATAEESTAYLDYILPRMRKDQQFLATEFSLMLKWKRHLRDPAPDAYADELGYAPGTPVWQVVEGMVDKPVEEAQWSGFLLANEWFSESRDYLQQQMKIFRDTERLAVAAYSWGQSDVQVKQFGPNGTPWIFNSVFATKTTRTTSSGLPGQNSTWAQGFESVQREQDERPVT
ncbi:hypothetical protein ACIBL8_47460 [Streptomyces sp. NPDC050523]|uniref:hypothetical protein n=1 Tax=Streptomyces sp. NPDC050523 TaxID=3365622 RepID=UPI00379CD915